MARKKCPNCGYKFKRVDIDSNICPECFAHIEDEIGCGSLSSVDHSHDNDDMTFSEKHMAEESKCDFLEENLHTHAKDDTTFGKSNAFPSGNEKPMSFGASKKYTPPPYNSSFRPTNTKQNNGGYTPPPYNPDFRPNGTNSDNNGFTPPPYNPNFRPNGTSFGNGNSNPNFLPFDSSSNPRYYGPKSVNLPVEEIEKRKKQVRKVFFVIFILFFASFAFTFIRGINTFNSAKKALDSHENNNSYDYGFNPDDNQIYTNYEDNSKLDEVLPSGIPINKLAPNGYILFAPFGDFSVIVNDINIDYEQPTDTSTVEQKYNVKIPSDYKSKSPCVCVVEYIIWDDILMKSFSFNADLMADMYSDLPGIVLDLNSESNFQGYANATKLTVTYYVPYDFDYIIRIPSPDGNKSIPDYYNKLSLISVKKYD